LIGTNRARYDPLVKTFFACDPQAITSIFREFLQAMPARETLPPAVCQCSPSLPANVRRLILRSPKCEAGEMI
jgi:hypothetical protein